VTWTKKDGEQKPSKNHARQTTLGVEHIPGGKQRTKEAQIGKKMTQNVHVKKDLWGEKAVVTNKTASTRMGDARAGTPRQNGRCR